MREISVTKAIHGYASTPLLTSPVPTPAAASTAAVGALTSPVRRMPTFDFGMSSPLSPSLSLASPLRSLAMSPAVPLDTRDLGVTLAALAAQAESVRSFMNEEKIMPSYPQR
jgi:hypothetical protein